MRSCLLGGQSVAAIGLGEVSLAHAETRGITRTDVVRRMHDAIESAVDLIDVAAEDDTERDAGDAVRTLRARDRVIVATRVAAIAERAGMPTRDTLPERLPVRYVQERIEAALRATKLDALSLAQLPLRGAWRASTAWPELVGTCDRLVREGKVLRWGAIVTAATADDAALAGEPWLASLSIELSICNRAAVPILAAAQLAVPAPLAASARSYPLLVLARSPLAGAALAGTIGPGIRFAPSDERRALTDAQLEEIAIGVAKLALLVKAEPPAVRSCELARAAFETGRRPVHVDCMTVAELALRYVIDRGAIALPRIHDRDHLHEALACAAAEPLSPGLHARITELWPDPAA